MSIEEIRKLLEDNVQLRATGINGTTTIVDQYRNADALLNELDSLGLDETSDEYKNFANMYKGQKGSAIMSGALTGLTGLVDLGSNMVRSSQLANTSYYDDQLAQREQFGNYNYGTYDQLANDIANNQPQLNPLSFEDVRGMNTGQKVGSVFTSALSGASTGAQIGGLWGGIAGGALGLATGLGGVLTGDANARAKQNYYSAKASQANAISELNLQAAHDRISDRDSRNKIARFVATGGQIQRTKPSLQDFASRVTGRQTNSVRRKPNTMERTYEDGGVRIRIKVK